MLDILFNPGSIAVIGATERPHAPGGKVMRFLVSHGYRGDIFPINPSRESVLGRACFSSISDLPGTPDLVVLAIPMDSALDSLVSDDLRLVKHLVVLASGDDAQRERFRRIVRERCLCVLGPNSLGFLNVSSNVLATFCSAAELMLLPPGKLAIVSQSGGVLAALINRAHDRGLGLDLAVATGDEVSVSTADVVAFLASRQETESILVYVETFRDGPKFVDAAIEARRASKNLIVVQAGVTPHGQSAAATHTGGVATDGVVGASVLAEVGAIQAHDLGMALDCAELVAKSRIERRTKPGPLRVGFISGSGGGSVLAVDAAYQAGLEVGRFSQNTVEKLSAVIPVYADPSNPLDVTAGALEHPEIIRESTEIISCDPNIDMTVLVGLATSETTASGISAGALAAHESNLPVMLMTETGSLSESAFQRVRGYGVTVIEGFRAAMDALAAVSVATPWKPVRKLSQGSADEGSQSIRPSTGELTPLGEAESLDFLRARGIPVVESFELSLDGELISSGELEFPVVAKVSSPQVFHKSRSRLIETDLRSQAELATATARLAEQATALSLEHWRVIAQPMVPIDLELFGGFRTDRAFGPVVSLGVGGRLMEQIGIVTVARAEAVVLEPDAFIESLGLPERMLGPKGVLRLIVLGLAALDGQGVNECDINPIVIGPLGSMAVDAKVVLRQSSSE